MKMYRTRKASLLLAVLLPVIVLGQQFVSGPQTEKIQTAQYVKIVYVDIAGGKETGDGSRNAPWKSIKAALEQIDVKGQQKGAVLVAEGTYLETGIQLRSGIDLYGGFRSGSWERDIQQYPTVLSGGGKQQILVGANNARVDGLVISGGSIRGNGGAIHCGSSSPTLTNNVFSGNKTLGPQSWAPKYLHETANNGGAVYGHDGAAPLIRNNLFVGNTTENGRGAAIAFDRKCKPVIDQNVFINNTAGLNDPMRSSDGGAISVFDWCNATITHNLFLGNKAIASNDGGAIFVALWSSARISNNILVDSESGDDAGALFVGGQEHRYNAPLDAIPPKEKFYVTIDHNRFFGNKNPSQNSGVMRLTMESRGEFAHNIMAWNTGVYFQRSEVAVKNNTILDNFLFIETKEGLKQGSIENNYIWGDFKLETPARVENNYIRNGFTGGVNNRKALPRFKNDGATMPIMAAVFNKARAATEILVEGAFAKNALANRVVRAGDKWGIIQANEHNRITIWGNLVAAEMQVLPTYSVLQP
jgi:hypothetical protein